MAFQSKSELLAFGATAPDFNLPAVDGRNYSLSQFKGKAKAVVVIFACNHCPYVQAYEDRMIQICKDFSEKGVAFLVINSNDEKNYPEDSFEKMKERAQQKKFPYPYLRDKTQKVAEGFGAGATPEVFLLDKDFKLQYHGRVDDNWQEPAKIQNHYLREALNAILSGQEVVRRETHPIGCSIKWSVFLLLFAFLGFSFQAEARIRQELLSSTEALTAGKLFLNQVDTVCLYLSTRHVAYTPRFEEANMHLKVTLTLLDVAYEKNSDRLKDFAMRNIKTFNKTLKERLELYTPELAKEFDANKDVEFFVQAGTSQTGLAHFKEGNWEWLAQLPAAPSTTTTEPPPEKVAEDLRDCKNKCPALKKKKSKETKIVGKEIPL